jgi:hypothetical protein
MPLNQPVVINHGRTRPRTRRNNRRQRVTNRVYRRRRSIQEDTLNRIVNVPRQLSTDNLLIDQFFNGTDFHYGKSLHIYFKWVLIIILNFINYNKYKFQNYCNPTCTVAKTYI